MIDAGLGEPAALRQISDAAIAAGFLVHRAGDFDSAGQFDAGIDQGFDRHDRGGDPAFHVAGAAAIDLAVAHDARRTDPPSSPRRSARRRDGR